ncbi:MAG: S-layer homology domain-containing protein [Clostridia bacterium]|nr:S-layer homology domain-containing protein [Clostridia bacterium]
MKKILAVFIITCMISSTIAVSANFDAENNGILDVLSELNIMTGDPDGNMRLDDYVSRAEFTKIAVAASSYRNSVATNLAVSPFPDVTYKHWSAPYVRVGVTKGIVSGYPDGNFRPEDTVLFEEAVTMLLRVLGYSNEDFGTSWPSGQIGLADNFDMTDDLECVPGEMMNRRQVAQLVYNTLKVKIKGQQNPLISIFDTQIAEDVTIIATSNEEDSVGTDEIFTSKGTYKINRDFNKTKVGTKGDAVIKNNTKLIAFVTDSQKIGTEEYVVYSVLSDKVMAYRDDRVSPVDIDDSTTVYKGKSQTTFSALKGQLELGDKLTVNKTDSGSTDYVTYSKGNVTGPVTALGGTWTKTLSLGDDTRYIRDGVPAGKENIQNYDILYYLKDLNIVMAYNSKITGIYEKAIPNKNMPASVTVSGKDYEIEGSTAYNKLYSGGSFEYGDTITLLLGRDNKIADVISVAETADGIVGYVTETGTKEYSDGEMNTYTNYYVKITTPEGISYDYITDKDYTESKNAVAEVSFKDGYARLTRINTSSTVSGTFNWRGKRLGSDKISSSIQILDIAARYANETSLYTKVYGQRLDGIDISRDDVLYAEKNSAGEIEKLILNNVTNDAFSYGIVLSAKKRGDSMVYEYLADGKRYTVNGAMSISAGNAAMIAGSPQRPDYLKSINVVKGNITHIASDKLIGDNVTYKISDKVAVYKRESATAQEYSMTDLSEVISNKDKYKITAFYDKESSKGGRIRVIVISEK